MLVLIFLAVIPILVISFIIFLIYVHFNNLYDKRFNHHFQFLNTEVVKITDNPQMLIDAYRTVNKSKANFRPSDDFNSFDDDLWLNPTSLSSSLWPLLKQIASLKF